MKRSWGIVIFVLVVGYIFNSCSGSKNPNVLVIGSKNFTEQFILGEIIAAFIESQTDIDVQRKWNLGGTMICHQALINGEIDLYVEYTGTAWVSILNQPVVRDADQTFRQVKKLYRKKFNCEWIEPLGYNNTYAITVRKSMAQDQGWKTIDDLRDDGQSLHAGFTAEFSERLDGYRGLQKAYNFTFGTVTDLDPGLMYKAIANKSVDVICAFSTDGRIPAYDLQSLKDNRHFFPPYYAAPVLRNDAIQRFPELKPILQTLANSIDNKTMQQMNWEVDGGKKDPKDVAREFLDTLMKQNRN